MVEADPGPLAIGGRGGEAGFTLLEMVVALAVLGLALALIVSRGPQRSAALEMRAVAGELVQALRLARGQAIMRDQAVDLTVDLAGHSYRIDGAPGHALPPAYGLVVIAAGTAVSGDRLGAIRFAPDGSSSGGRIELSDGRRRMRIGIDWLTGRVTLAEIAGEAGRGR